MFFCVVSVDGLCFFCLSHRFSENAQRDPNTLSVRHRDRPRRSHNPLRDRRGRGAKTHGFFKISAAFAQPSAGIGVVEVQKLEDIRDFCCSNWSSGVGVVCPPVKEPNSRAGLRLFVPILPQLACLSFLVLSCIRDGRAQLLGCTGGLLELVGHRGKDIIYTNKC